MVLVTTTSCLIVGINLLLCLVLLWCLEGVQVLYLLCLQCTRGEKFSVRGVLAIHTQPQGYHLCRRKLELLGWNAEEAFSTPLHAVQVPGIRYSIKLVSYACQHCQLPQSYFME